MKLTLINFARLILGMQFLLFGCSDVKEDIDSIHKSNYNVDELF